MKNNYRKKFILLQSAVLLFGCSSVLSRTISASSITIAGGRVICSSLILLVVLLIKKESLKSKTWKDTLLTITSGILLATHWATFFQSVQMGSVAIGTITFSTFPLFLLILEPLIYHEKISIRNILLSLGLLAGVFITIPEFSMSNQKVVAIAWGMVCSLTYAILTLCNRKLSGSYSGVWISFREQSVAAIILIPVMLIRQEAVTLKDAEGIFAIGVICTALAFSLFVTAQRYVSAQVAGISAGMETVYGILLAVIFLRDIPTVREIIGGVVIIGIVTLSAILEHRKVK